MKQVSRRGKVLKRLMIILVAVILILAGYGGFRYSRPLPTIKPVDVFKMSPVGTSTLAWPAASASAIGAMGYGVLAENGSSTPRPIASVAKLITALTVLKKYPLSIGQPGPTITLSQSDVNIYNSYLAQNGSVAAVEAGEQITEYEMLEGMMLPSADNLADSLAIWAYGSLSSYAAAANLYVKSLGMNDTTVGSDASGLSPTTVSTAHDLIILGETALNNPVLKVIVDTAEGQLPVSGVVYNYNKLLGQDGIIGIKTGNSDQAGGVYLFAANYSPDSGTTITIVGVVQGTATLDSALQAGQALLKSAENNFSLQSVIPAGSIIATYSVPWTKTTVPAVTKNTLSALIWKGGTPQTDFAAMHNLNSSAADGYTVGSVSLSSNGASQSVPVVLSGSVPAPSLWWRITH